MKDLCSSKFRISVGLAAAALLCVGGCHRAQPQQAQQAQPQPARPPPPSPPKPPLPPPQKGMASYYGPEFAGKTTASGEPHEPNSMTAASRTLPLGTTAKVTNRETGKSVSVQVNDRGPYAKNRVLDVSPKAAKHLGMKQEGVAPVTVQPLKVPPADKRPDG